MENFQVGQGVIALSLELLQFLVRRTGPVTEPEWLMERPLREVPGEEAMRAHSMIKGHSTEILDVRRRAALAALQYAEAQGWISSEPYMCAVMECVNVHSNLVIEEAGLQELLGRGAR